MVIQAAYLAHCPGVLQLRHCPLLHCNYEYLLSAHPYLRATRAENGYRTASEASN